MLQSFNTISEFHNCSLSDFHESSLANLVEGLKEIEADYETPIPRIKKDITKLFSDEGFITDVIIHPAHRLDVNGIKEDICFGAQLGNAARFYADVIKMQYLFIEGVITKAIYVTFTRDFIKKSYSGNNISFERAISEITLFKSIITLPIYFIGIDLEE